MTIKVISLNIWLGGFLQDNVMSFLKAQGADIILLQEVYNGQDPTLTARYRTMQILKEKLDFPYENFAPEYRDFERTNGKAQLGNAILSRFPISSSSISTFSPYTEDHHNVCRINRDCPYILQHVVMSTPVGKVNTFNIHGVCDLDGDKFSPLRRKMSDVVVGAVKNKKNVILAGDMNAKPTNKAVTAIEGYLKSVFGHELTTTFNMLHKDNSGYATASVDMMFVSPSIRIAERKCLNVDVSDHLPLSVTLEVG